jgi:thiamine-phosphate pyrophosphorylase
MRIEPPLPRGLYAITPDWRDTRRLLEATAAILDAGCRLVQYRNKAASPCHRQEQAVALRGLTRRHDARLIVNDDLELALFCEADGVHLGEDDGGLAAARKRLDDSARKRLDESPPAGKILGASCYQSLERALAEAKAGADYLAFGSFFASPTKPQAKRADSALLAAAKAATGLPVCAIGGITAARAGELIAAGADLLAVISALYDVPDPYRAAREFMQFFEETV